MNNSQTSIIALQLDKAQLQVLVQIGHYGATFDYHVASPDARDWLLNKGLLYYLENAPKVLKATKLGLDVLWHLCPEGHTPSHQYPEFLYTIGPDEGIRRWHFVGFPPASMHFRAPTHRAFYGCDQEAAQVHFDHIDMSATTSTPNLKGWWTNPEELSKAFLKWKKGDVECTTEYHAQTLAHFKPTLFN